MPTMTVLVDGTIPVAADFMANFTALNQAIGTATVITGYTTGDLLYASAADTLSKLAIGTTDRTLRVTGGVPVWAPSAVSIVAFSNAAALSTAGTYWAGGAAPFTLTDGNLGKIPMAVGGVAKNLRCWISSALAGGSSMVFTLIVDGAATALTATIGAGATIACDTTHTVSITAGQVVQMQLDKTGTDNEDMGVTFQYTTA